MKVLVIGFGSIGERHTEVLKQIPEVEEIEIVSKRSNLDFRRYSKIEQVDLTRFNYIVVSNETHKHFETLSYLNNNCENKLVLIEKPIFRENQRFTEDLKNQYFVSYNMRFHPVIRFLKTELKDKKVLTANLQVGQYLPMWKPDRDYRESYNAFSEQGGGVLLDLSHEFDILLYLFGTIENLKSDIGKISSLEINSEDYGAIIGQTKKGVHFILQMDYFCHLPNRLMVINTESCSYFCDLIESKIVTREKSGSKSKEYLLPFERNEIFMEMHRDILFNSINPSSCSFEEGIESLNCIYQIKS